MWFHAIQLLTTFIPSRKFGYLLKCSAVDIHTYTQLGNERVNKSTNINSFQISFFVTVTEVL